MKTWEMIKELTENPKKEFKVVCDELEEETLISTKNGEIIMNGCQVLYTLDEWEEVKKPVDFMTAVKSDKRIWFPGISGEEEYLPLDMFLKEIASNYYRREIVAIITDGEFYIEGQGKHK